MYCNVDRDTRNKNNSCLDDCQPDECCINCVEMPHGKTFMRLYILKNSVV